MLTCVMDQHWKANSYGTYSPAEPGSGSLIFLGRPALGFGGLLPDFGVLLIKWEKISVCFSKNSKRLDLSVSILLSKSPSLPLEEVVSLEDPFWNTYDRY